MRVCQDTKAVSMSVCANVCVLCVIRRMEEGAEGENPEQRSCRKEEEEEEEEDVRGLCRGGGKDLRGDGRATECVCGQVEGTVGVCVCVCVFLKSVKEERDRQGEKEAVFLNTQFCFLSNPGTAVGIKGGS